MPGLPFTTPEDLIGYANYANTRPKLYGNLYYCLSSQVKAGKEVNGRVMAHRDGDNVAALKAVWIDLDVGPDKGYPTVEAALEALKNACVRHPLPTPSAIVFSGGGLHVYWINDTPMTVGEWSQYSEGLRAAGVAQGLKADWQCTIDSVRVLRIPGTLNHKFDPPRRVKILALSPTNYVLADALGHTKAAPGTLTPLRRRAPASAIYDVTKFTQQVIPPGGVPSLGLQVYEDAPLAWEPLAGDGGCPHVLDALRTNGAPYAQPLWHLDALLATFLKDGRRIFHRMSKGHKSYDPGDTNKMFDRKVKEKEEQGPGWPSCAAIESAGCKSCAACPRKGKIKSPLNLTFQSISKFDPRSQQTRRAAETSFVDPYGEFIGSAFPLDVLPPTLSEFVDAEHRAMGADPSAIAMAVLTAVAGAMHAETQVRAGDGWWEKPILWTALVGQPSTMKSPIIEKTTKPLIRIDQERKKRWRQDYATWKQLPNATQNTTPPPPKPLRCIIMDATPEKVAEILSRDPSGSLMVHDELAGWLGGFDRYNSGQPSRAFYLKCWNGGTHTQDRVGKGKRDADAEIHVDNLALCILGGIQPDRLAELPDLTSDGLLQRFLPVLMAPAERGDEYYPVAVAEADYEKLIKSINDAPPQNYHFEDDAFEVRERVIDCLHKLEGVDGFSSSLIGAIGKLRGYFARICLVLHVARQHDPMDSNEWLKDDPTLLERFPRADCERLRKLFGEVESLSAGLNSSIEISRWTAETAEKVLHQFLLPHIFGLYDVVVNGGQDRDMVQSIGDFILASNKDRLRPSDITAGVRALRGQPEQKIKEWMGRFCAMGWLEAEEARPGVPPKAWLVVPGLREHFAERRKQAQEARAEAHAILKTGGSRKPAQQRV